MLDLFASLSIFFGIGVIIFIIGFGNTSVATVFLVLQLVTLAITIYFDNK